MAIFFQRIILFAFIFSFILLYNESKIMKISNYSNNIFPKKNWGKCVNAPNLNGDKSKLKLNGISVNYEFIK